MKAKIIKEKISANAKELHEKLLESGLKVWGVVASPEEVEIYFYEEEESEERVKVGIEKIKKGEKMLLVSEGEVLNESTSLY